MMRLTIISTLVYGLWFLASPSAHALIDTDADGMGDIWENIHGFHIGAYTPSGQLPTDDPDKDGFPNLAESRAGTDPGAAASLPAHLFSFTPPVYEAVEPTEPATEPTASEDPFAPAPAPLPAGPPPALIDPPVSTLTWPTVPGKTYQPIPSEDLASWPQATATFFGEGITQTMESETLYPDGTVPPKLFWRVEINDIDSDGDGLTDYEELHIRHPDDPSITLNPNNTDSDGDGIPDGEEYIPGTNGLPAFTNALLTDPDGPGLPALLENDLIGRWDLEATHNAPALGDYYTLARYADSTASARHIVPFYTETKPDGMPSKAAGATPSAVGFLCPPRTLLHNRTTYSVSLWAKIEKDSITASRPIAALFSHHRRLPKPSPYAAQFRIDINGMWIERLANGTHVLRAGTSNFINYTPGTNQQVNGTWSFNGVSSAAKPAGTLDDGQWHHYLAVRTSGTVTLYMDGIPIGTNNSVTIADINATNETKAGISLGRYHGEPAEDGLPYTDPQAAKASFDRVRVWSRTLTASDAQSLFKQDADKDGLWDITEERTRRWADHNGNAIAEPGEFVFVANPLHHDAEDADHDIDLITSLHEQNLTQTAIDKADTDGDGLPDGWENAHPPLNPKIPDNGSADPDGDGLTTAQEYAGGVTNPFFSDAHLYPPTWISVERSLRYDYDDYGISQPNVPKILSTTSTWPGSTPTAENLTAIIPFNLLHTALPPRQPFPANFPSNNLSPDLSAGGSAQSIPSPDCYHASLTARRIIVKLAFPATETREFKALLLTERSIDGIPQPDQAEDITLTVPAGQTQSSPYDLLPSFLGSGFGGGAYSETVQQKIIFYEITEVISDQIAGNEANKLPTATYGGQPNNPMLMATRTGQNAKFQIAAKIDPSFISRMFIGARVVGEPAILGSATPAANGSRVPLAFKAQDGSKTYEIVLGFDNNKNGTYEGSETVYVFQKTPKLNEDGITPYSGGDSSFSNLDKIIIVTRNDFSAGRQETEDYGDSFFFENLRTEGAKLLKLFSTGATSIVGADPTTYGYIVDASVIPSPQGLSHPLGGKWNAMNKASTFKITYPSGSDLAGKVVTSDGFKALVARIIVANKAALVASATGTIQTSAPIPFNDDQVAFGNTDSKSDVHLTLGKCKAAGGLIVSYKSAAGGKIEVAEVNCYGTINDLYDFAYGTKLEFPITGTQIDLTKHAARTQAGYATLAAGTWPNAGRVFFTEVNFGSGWLDWNDTIY